MKTQTVLIVDDNAANMKLLSYMVNALGHRVLMAANAEEALQCLETERPQLILMDIQLPGMDGLELTRRLKADPIHRRIWIVAVTASAMKGDEEKALEAGCDGYITKPIDTRSLPRVLASYLERDDAEG